MNTNVKETKFGTVDIKGKKFDVLLDERGMFYSVVDGDRVTAPTFDQLKAKLADTIARSKVKVNVPFVRWEDGKLRKGVVTGIHASNGNLIVRWEGQKGSEQDRSWSRDDYVQPSSAAQLEKLARAKERAEKELDEFMAEHTFDAKARVRREMVNKGETVSIDDEDE